MAILEPNEIFYTAFEPRLTNRFILYMEGIPAYLVKGMGAISLSQTAVALNHINVQRYVKGAIYFNHLLKKMGLETKYEKITSGGKVKKIYVAPNKYQIDTLCYTGSYPVEFVDFQVDYTEMFPVIFPPTPTNLSPV